MSSILLEKKEKELMTCTFYWIAAGSLLLLSEIKSEQRVSFASVAFPGKRQETTRSLD